MGARGDLQQARLSYPSSCLCVFPDPPAWAGVRPSARRVSMQGTGSYPAGLWADDWASRDAARGLHHRKGQPQTACVKDFPAPPQTYASNAAGVAEFRRHYATPQTRVMVYNPTFT